jgi:dipeptidyl aminopeptidase/acylaminoacyl peptidase
MVLAGGSFGGSVALVAGVKTAWIREIIAVAAVTDWRSLGRGPYSEKVRRRGGVAHHRRRIPQSLACQQSRLSRLGDGPTDLNPVDYLDLLKDKSVFLVHGGRDEALTRPDHKTSTSGSSPQAAGIVAC